MLTQKQRDLLSFIQSRLQDDEVSPSFDEMKDALGLKSKSGIHRLINGLVERGYLERLPNRARALSVIRVPESMQRANTQTPPRPQAANMSDPFAAPISGLRALPLYGKIAAGTPIEAIRHDGAYFDVPMNLLSTGEYYALQVDGDSMIEAGINDHDIVIIKRAQNAQNGQIVVALVDQQEATLKRLKNEGRTITLLPENSSHSPQQYEAERVQIQGVLAGLIRTYN